MTLSPSCLIICKFEVKESHSYEGMWKDRCLLSKYKESKDNTIPRIAKCSHFSVDNRVWPCQTPSSGPQNSFDLSVIVLCGLCGHWLVSLWYASDCFSSTDRWSVVLIVRICFQLNVKNYSFCKWCGWLRPQAETGLAAKRAGMLSSL